MEIRAFSVKQPWAGLLMAGVKRFEVRTWPLRALGVLLVHASSGKAPGMPALRAEALFQKSLREAGMTDEKGWSQRAFLGLVEVKRIIKTGDALPKRFTKQDAYLCGGTDGLFLWEIGERWPFATPVPCDGYLMLWKPPAELRATLNRRLAAAPVQITAA